MNLTDSLSDDENSFIFLRSGGKMKISDIPTDGIFVNAIEAEIRNDFQNAIFFYGILIGRLESGNRGSVGMSLSRAHFSRAQMHRKAGNLFSSEVDLNKAITLDKRNYDSYMERGILYLQMENAQKAVRDFEFALSLKNDYRSLYRFQEFWNFSTSASVLSCFQFGLCLIRGKMSGLAFKVYEECIRLQIPLDSAYYNEKELVKELKDRRKMEVLKKMKIIVKLGKGSFGAVYLVKIKGIRSLLVLKVFKDLEACEKVRMKIWEKENLSISNHPNVVPVLHSIQNCEVDFSRFPDYESFWKESIEEDNYHPFTSCMFMMYYPTDLYRFMKCEFDVGVVTNSEMKKIINILQQLIIAICHLHECRVVHCDLHPQNVFIHDQDMKVYIGDFGCSLDLSSNSDGFKVKRDSELTCKIPSVMYSSTPQSALSTRNIWPPEVNEGLSNENSKFVNWEKCDSYSVGILGRLMMNRLRGKKSLRNTHLYVVKNSRNTLWKLTKGMTHSNFERIIGCNSARIQISNLKKDNKTLNHHIMNDRNYRKRLLQIVRRLPKNDSDDEEEGDGQFEKNFDSSEEDEGEI